jgi:predicted RNase H-like nuclease (RuvC/YqgF family)
MSDTPETDAAIVAAGGDWSPVLRAVAQRLERERDEEMRWHHRTHQELVETQCKLMDITQERDKLHEELMEWRPLCLWGGTPEYIHQFIKGQQARIHRTQDIEAQLKEAGESCEMWIKSLGEAREKIERLERERDELQNLLKQIGNPTNPL